jgi:nucleotide-binding universal stress UspA family protein
MKNILFTTEFSDHAGNVYRYALELAKAFGSTITLGIPYGKPSTVTDVLSKEEKKERALKRLQEFAANNTPESHKKISVKYDAVHAFPGEGILRLAEHNQVDLIVMSMTGAYADDNQHFSDTTLNVLRRADRPVLAVPDSATYNGLNRMVFSTDFQFNDLIALNMLRRWSEKFDAKIMTVHVLGRTEERDEDRESMEALETAYSGHQQMQFKLLPSGRTKQELHDYLDENEAELLAMTTSKKSRLWQLLEGSTTRKMARSVKIPLLVIKDFDDLN